MENALIWSIGYLSGYFIGFFLHRYLNKTTYKKAYMRGYESALKDMQRKPPAPPTTGSNAVKPFYCSEAWQKMREFYINSASDGLNIHYATIDDTQSQKERECEE